MLRPLSCAHSLRHVRRHVEDSSAEEGAVRQALGAALADEVRDVDSSWRVSRLCVHCVGVCYARCSSTGASCMSHVPSDLGRTGVDFMFCSAATDHSH